MAKAWTHIRIARDTLQELCRVRESLRVAEMMGVVTLEPDNRDRVSIDQVITRLIAIRDKHAERRKRSALRRASRKATKQSQPTDNGQAEEQLRSRDDNALSPHATISQEESDHATLSD